MAGVGIGESVKAEINWPIVAGLGIAAAVLFYALYIVNEQFQQADALLGGAASDVQNVVNDVQSITSPVTKAFDWVGSLFGGDDSDNGDNSQ